MSNQNEHRVAEASQDEELNIGEYIAAIYDRRWFIVGVALFFTLIGSMYALFAAPIYRANVVVQAEDSDKSNGLLKGELTPLLEGKAVATAEIEIFRSKMVISKAISQLHLMIDASPKYFPIFGRWYSTRDDDTDPPENPVEPLWGLGSYAWGGERIQVSEFAVPLSRLGERFTLRAEQPGNYLLFDDETGKQVLTGVVGTLASGTVAGRPVSLKVDELKARPGTRFNLRRYSDLSRTEILQGALSVNEMGKQSGVLNVALDGASPVKTAEILNSLADAYVKQNVDRKSAEAEQTLAFLERQLPSMRDELNKAEEKYNQFRARNGTVDLTEEAQLTLKQSVESNTKLIQLQQDRLEMLQKFTAAHPTIKALNEQIAAIEREQGTIAKQIGGLPDVQQTAVRLQRDVRVATELYTNLLSNAQQLRVLKAGKIGNVRVIDHAEIPERPVKPNRLMIVLGSVGLGLLAGLAAAFALKALRRGMEKPDEVEAATGVPVYASIPQSDKQKMLNDALNKKITGQHVLANQYPDDVTVESLRSLRTSLQFAMLDAVNNVVMITGPSPGVGKSFISVNLAVILAATGKKVLLIDGDMRRGYIHDIFGVSRNRGISEVISGRLTSAEAIQNVSAGLDFMSTGTVPPNPAELLVSGRFSELLSALSSQYDIVIIDSPPVLAVTDSAIIGEHVGTTLLCLRYGRHSKAEVQEAVRRLRQSGVHPKGILFNAIPRRAGLAGYYGGYYHYNYASDKT